MKVRRFWSMQNAQGDSSVGELSIYGKIAGDEGLSWLFDELTPKAFKDELDALGNIDVLNVAINSPGGDTFAGQAIHSILNRHRAHVNVYIDGLAASIASLVAMAGDTVVMPRNAMMMVHDPFTAAIGNAREFRKLAETLDTVRESMIAAYQSKTELDHDEIVALLEAETWLTAEDAVAQGFADEIEASKSIEARFMGDSIYSFAGLGTAVQADFSNFKNPPDLRDEGRGKLTIRDAEKALTASGFPRALAKSIASRGFKPQSDPAPASPESTDRPDSSSRLLMDYYKAMASFNS